MRVKKLLHTRMRVSDMDETIRFYTEVLGLEVLERKTSPRGSIWPSSKCRTARS